VSALPGSGGVPAAPAASAPRAHVLASSLAAGGAAAFASSLAISLSTPALTRPLLPSILFVAVPPALAAALLAPLLGRLQFLRLGGRAAAAVAACLAALPWLGVAAAPMGRFRGVLFVAAAAALLLGSLRASRSLFRALPALGALGLLAVPRPGVIALDGPRSCVILGFDAATWEQIDLLIGAGELPHFRELRARGASGILRSESPIASPVVWTTIATGVDPKLHGIHSFGSLRSDLRAGRIWDEVVAAGGSAGVVGWLANWPPDPALRFSVPSWLDAGDLSLPPAAAFAKRLQIAARARRGLLAPSNLGLVSAGLSVLAVSRADDAWRLIGDLVWLMRRSDTNDRTWRVRLFEARLQTDLFLELLDRARPQLSALVTYPTDSLAHSYWRYHEPGLFPSVTPEEVEKHGQVVRDSYRTADAGLGKILSRLDLSHTTVILVSDHGMQALPESEKRPRVRQDVLVDALGMVGELDVFDVSPDLVVTPRRAGPEGEAVLSRAAAALAAAVDADHAESPLFEVRRDPKQPHNLHVVLLREDMAPGERIRIGERVFTAEQFFVREHPSGRHNLNGLFLIAGPGVQPGARLDAELRDVAPTVLYVLGLEVPSSLEGSSLPDAFSAGWLAKHPPTRRDGALANPPKPLDARMDADLVDAQLKELGYVQ